MFSLNSVTIFFVKKIIQTWHLLYQRTICYHTTNKAQLTYNILTLTLNHALVNLLHSLNFCSFGFLYLWNNKLIVTIQFNIANTSDSMICIFFIRLNRAAEHRLWNRFSTELILVQHTIHNRSVDGRIVQYSLHTQHDLRQILQYH